ncbi:MAG: sugar phosphate isomerase/epimerase [Anaerolineae bacterium]|nr:sugar phosphate isomerase/epimerase [Anaerolineae bacterium]
MSQQTTDNSTARRIGLSTGSLFPAYLTEDALNAAAQLGFSTVEVYLQTHGEYAPAFVAEVRRRLDSLGLTVHSVHNDIRHFDLWSAYARRADESHALFERLVDVAAAWNAQAITWHGTRDPLDTPDEFGRFAATVGTLAERAGSVGVTLTIENVRWCYVRGVEQIRHVRDTGLPLGFTFDPFQAAEAGQDPAAVVRAMGDRLTTVHLSDFGTGVIRHLPLGQGTLDWPVIFHALAEVHYQGPLIVEVPFRGDLDVLAQGRAFVEHHLAAGPH